MVQPAKRKEIYLRNDITFILWGLFLCFLSFQIRAEDQLSAADSAVIGEAIYFGTSRTGDSSFSCYQCHNVTTIDTFNWNPSGHEIARKFKDKSSLELEEVLFLPLTDAAFEAHEPILDFASDDIHFLKAYLNTLALQVEPSPPKDRTTLIYLIVCVFVILIGLADLVFIRIVKRRKVLLAIITTALVFVFAIAYAEGIRLGLQGGYQPGQPVKFSHKTHCGQNRIECLYCHMPAIYSKSAGIPAVNICMNCHASVVQASQSGEFEIRKIIEAYETGKPVPWIRVNNLPDHVFFSHAIHYKTGQIDCVTCHGEVKEHDEFVQERELSMSWCLDCHAERKIDHTNPYYNVYGELINTLQEGDSILVKDVGGWECMRCHY